MKITAVSLSSGDEAEPIRFDLRNTENTTPYLIKEITGLDADEIVPKFYGYDSFLTKRFYDLRMKPRTIVMKLVMNPRFHLDEDHSQIRDHVYRAISSTRAGQLELRFHSGGSTPARLFGFITKFEVPYFGKSPEVKITMRCSDPWFRGINPVWKQGPEFPNGNPIVVADGSSTAPHGMHMIVRFNATRDEFELRDKDTSPDWAFKIVTPDDPFLANDTLHFSNDFTDKWLYRARNGVMLHLMDRVQPPLMMPIIFPGMNRFYSPQRSYFEIVYVRYHTAYWGV